MSGMARPMKRKTAKGPSPAAGVSAKPDPAHRRPVRPGARLRRAADIVLITLGVAAIGLFIAVKIIGGRTEGPADAGGKNGTGAPTSTVGPETTSSPSAEFADLETGPDEFEGGAADEPLAGPAAFPSLGEHVLFRIHAHRGGRPPRHSDQPLSRYGRHDNGAVPAVLQSP